MDTHDLDAGWQDLRPDLDPFLMSMPGDAQPEESAPTVCIAHSGPLTTEQLEHLVGQSREGLREFFERFGAGGA